MSIWTELALSYQKEMNRRYAEVNKTFNKAVNERATQLRQEMSNSLLYGTAPTLLGKRADMLMVDDVVAELQRIKEDAMPERPSKRQHCHLCFARKVNYDLVERHEVDKKHIILQTVEFKCGTKVDYHMTEEYIDGEWCETDSSFVVTKGANCI